MYLRYRTQIEVEIQYANSSNFIINILYFNITNVKNICLASVNLDNALYLK